MTQEVRRLPLDWSSNQLKGDERYLGGKNDSFFEPRPNVFGGQLGRAFRKRRGY